MDSFTNITFEQELTLLGIDYDDYQYISDGSYGYFLILVSDLDEEQELKLKKHPDFYKIEDDLWARKLENPTELPHELLSKLLDFKKERDRERIKAEFLSEITNRWDSIVSKKKYLNELGVDLEIGNFFKTTIETELISAKLSTFICTNENEFRLFCRDLYCYFLESKLEPLKRYKNHKFSKYLEILRHAYIHDSESGYDKNGYMKRIQKKNDIFYELIGKRHIDPANNFSTDFIELQIRLFDLCIDWLNRIYEEIKK